MGRTSGEKNDEVVNRLCSQVSGFYPQDVFIVRSGKCRMDGGSLKNGGLSTALLLQLILGRNRDVINPSPKNFL